MPAPRRPVPSLSPPFRGRRPGGGERSELGRRPGRPAAGFTLTELLLFSLVVGLAALVVAPWALGLRERRWTGELRERVDSVLAGVDAFHEARGRWPGTLRELDREVDVPVSEDVRICVFNIVPSGPDAPYVVVVAGHRRSRTRVFTFHPLWDGRTETYRASGLGCDGREPYAPAAPLPIDGEPATSPDTGPEGAREIPTDPSPDTGGPAPGDTGDGP